MKIEIDGSLLMVRFKCRTWELASRVMLSNRERPPTGYKVMSAQVQNRSDSGSRASLGIRFKHVDKNAPVFSLHEAYAFFAGDREIANGPAIVAD